MWKKLYEVLSRLLALTQKVERHDKEILGLQREVKDLTAVAQRLVYELQRISDRETTSVRICNSDWKTNC